ncbi:hypothetical protein [Streptomyces sp. IMTB 2501]|uniref:hypothetical protein n=1 Tax=Streptomyces sp. IMTB 2501 TaxID=1776340 RepID=UPI002116AF7E|nr:hypothetical protein [Streptomyces sp. IMTB 2501]
MCSASWQQRVRHRKRPEHHSPAAPSARPTGDGCSPANRLQPDPPAGQRSRPFAVDAIDDPALPELLAELAAARADEMDADTVNRELSIARKAIG